MLMTCFYQGPMGPNGLPGQPGVKVGSLLYCTYKVWWVFLLFFSKNLKQLLFSQGNQGDAGIGVQVR